MSERSLWTPDKNVVIELPAPSGYRQSSVPPVFPTSEDSLQTKRFRRKRLYFWFGVAVALHIALLLTFFLSPKLRLKAGYSPDRWVQIVPLEQREPEKSIASQRQQPLASGGAR
jgi:hypothetical protein